MFRTTEEMLEIMNSLYNKEDVKEWLLEEIERIDPNVIQIALENIWDQEKIENEIASL